MVKHGPLLIVLIATAIGCGSDPAQANAQKAADLSVEERVKQIENTPGMPEDQKARVIEQIRHPQTPGKP